MKMFESQERYGGMPPKVKFPHPYFSKGDLTKILLSKNTPSEALKELNRTNKMSAGLKTKYDENKAEVENALKKYYDLVQYSRVPPGQKKNHQIENILNQLAGKSKEDLRKLSNKVKSAHQQRKPMTFGAELGMTTEAGTDIGETDIKEMGQAQGSQLTAEERQQMRAAFEEEEEEEGEPEIEGELLPWERLGFVPEPEQEEIRRAFEEEEAEPRQQILSSRVMPIPFKMWEMLVKQTIPLSIGDARSMGSRFIALSLFENLKWSGNRPTVSLPQALNETIKQLPPELKTFARDNERDILIYGQRLINQLSEQMESFGKVEERQQVEELPEEEDEPLRIELTPGGEEDLPDIGEDPWRRGWEEGNVPDPEFFNEDPWRRGWEEGQAPDPEFFQPEEDIETIPDAAPYQDVTMPQRIDPGSAVVADPSQELRRETGVTLPIKPGEIPSLNEFIKITGTPMTVDLQSFLNAVMNRKEQETSIFDDKDPSDKMRATIIYTRFTPRPSRKQIKKVLTLEELANLQPYMSHVYAKNYKSMPNFISDAVVSPEGFAMIADFLGAPVSTNALRIDSIWGNSGGDFFSI